MIADSAMASSIYRQYDHKAFPVNGSVLLGKDF